MEQQREERLNNLRLMQMEDTAKRSYQLEMKRRAIAEEAQRTRGF